MSPGSLTGCLSERPGGRPCLGPPLQRSHQPPWPLSAAPLLPHLLGIRSPQACWETGLKMPVTVFPRADLSQLPSTCANRAPAPRFSLMETMLMALYLLTSKSVMEETTRATMDPFLKSDTSSRRASGRPFRACCRRRRCQHRR